MRPIMCGTWFSGVEDNVRDWNATLDGYTQLQTTLSARTMLNVPPSDNRTPPAEDKAAGIFGQSLRSNRAPAYVLPASQPCLHMNLLQRS